MMGMNIAPCILGSWAITSYIQKGVSQNIQPIAWRSRETYHLLPCPIATYQMLIHTNTISIEDMVWNKVHTILKVWVSKYFMNDQPRVTKEDLIDVWHPLWLRRIASIVTVHVVILNWEALPEDTPNIHAIDCRIEFSVIGEWDLPAKTYLKEIVDVSLRHLSLLVYQLCDSESLFALECSPISWVCVYRWRRVQLLSRHRIAAILSTRFSCQWSTKLAAEILRMGRISPLILRWLW